MNIGMTKINVTGASALTEIALNDISLK